MCKWGLGEGSRLSSKWPCELYKQKDTNIPGLILPAEIQDQQP